MNMCPGLCVIMNGGRDASATAWGVTPHAQKTGTSPRANSCASPQSGRAMSATPMAAGSPTCTGAPWAPGNRALAVTAFASCVAAIGRIETTIGLMKPGAIYINTSRGPVQDERALFEALTRGKLGAAGLDVWEDEPTSADNPILNLQNVVCSSHVAGVTREATRQAAMQVSGEMLRVLRGERPDVLVNPDVWPRLGQR